MSESPENNSNYSNQDSYSSANVTLTSPSSQKELHFNETEQRAHPKPDHNIFVVVGGVFNLCLVSLQC